MTVPCPGIDSYKTRAYWWPETVCYDQLSLRVSLENLRKGKTVKWKYRQNDSRTRTTTWARLTFKVCHAFSKNRLLGKLYFTFSHQKRLARLFLLKEIKTSPDRKKIKFLTFATCFPRYDILAKTRSMTGAGLLAFGKSRARSCPRIRIERSLLRYHSKPKQS